MRYFEVFSQSDIEAIHENVLRILSEVGLVIGYAPAVDCLKKAGCKTDGERVYFPPELVEERRKLAPSSFTVYGRNPAQDVTFDRDAFVTIPAYGSPVVHHHGEERRDGTRDDFIKFTKLTQSSKSIDVASAVPCEMADVDMAIRDAEYVRTILEYCEKPFVVSKTAAVLRAAFDQCCILYGSADELTAKPRFLAITDSLPPLGYDHTMAELLMFCAEHGIPQRIGGLGLAGLTTPVTWAGSLSQMMAEALAGIVLAQCIRPGTPVVLNNSTSCADMRSLMLSVGAPESALNCIGTAQMARFYGIPCRSGGGIADSKLSDAQAGAESMMNLLTSALSGANFILHACGILDAYMASSLEKFIIDEECCAMVKHIRKGIAVTPETLAFECIREVGPQGTYLTHDHTMEHYQELFRPALFNRDSYSQWQSTGSQDCVQLAKQQWERRIAEFSVPPLPAATQKALTNYVNR